ncbi:MAG: hypothetical protein ACRCVT_05495 [Leadbetterella sp.]
MAKAVDSLENIHTSLDELDLKMKTFLNHQSQLIDNYDILIANQQKVSQNHDIVVSNQQTIIKNQGIITQNQSSIIHNQAVIVKNQAYLKTFLHTQAEILSLLTRKSKAEIDLEVNAFFENAQKEIASGFEKAVNV